MHWCGVRWDGLCGVSWSCDLLRGRGSCAWQLNQGRVHELGPTLTPAFGLWFLSPVHKVVRRERRAGAGRDAAHHPGKLRLLLLGATQPAACWAEQGAGKPHDESDAEMAASLGCCTWRRTFSR